MEKEKRIYAAIDLKSFYASVECVDRNLDPLTTNLVVADESKSEKTICLAVTPSLKKFGISGRARLFEVIQKVKEVNIDRRKKSDDHTLVGESFDEIELEQNPNLSLSYIAAPPRMAHYLDVSTEVYKVYLKYVSEEDIHVYSIDEVFIDLTSYLKMYHKTPKALVKEMIQDVYHTTGITATAGIGTNLYLCKIAMDILAKKVKADKDGVRIALLDEQRYRKLLWKHKPITDFWRVGKGYTKRLEQLGLFTMGDIAKCSLGDCDGIYNEDILYKTFGINAELLIDHAWGLESCTMKEIKSYQPTNHSLGTGQVLASPYSFEKARLIVKEMLDLLSLDLVSKRLVSDQIVLTIGYDIENVKHGAINVDEIKADYYGRKIPQHAHGTANIGRFTSSTRLITDAVMELYNRIVDGKLTIRRINISANHVITEDILKQQEVKEQMNLFVDYDVLDKQEEQLQKSLEKENSLQQTTLKIKKKYGKNALLKGMNLEEGAKTIERNGSIGGHKA